LYIRKILEDMSSRWGGTRTSGTYEPWFGSPTISASLRHRGN